MSRVFRLSAVAALCAGLAACGDYETHRDYGDDLRVETARERPTLPVAAETEAQVPYPVDAGATGPAEPIPYEQLAREGEAAGQAAPPAPAPKYDERNVFF